MIVSPFLGRAVDHFGRRGWLATMGTALSIGCFFLFANTDVNPILPMIMLGMAYCVCAATLWPSIQFLVDLKAVGIANGIATSMQVRRGQEKGRGREKNKRIKLVATP